MAAQRRIVRNALFALVPLALSTAVQAAGAVLLVANNGVDGSGCGTKGQVPCRSITSAIANASPGDTIVVGPGTYGDLNLNGILGETGEEAPTAGCGCMIDVNKPVTLISSDGAAATLVDARTAIVPTNVRISTGGPNGGTFGLPAQGFTVTNTASSDSNGIEVDSAGVIVKSNQVIGNRAFQSENGILAGSARVLIDGNQVTGWSNGISVNGSNATVSRNVATFNLVGVLASGSNLVVGNVLTGNTEGISLTGAATAFGNNAIGNTLYGVIVPFQPGGFTGSIARNNLFGNGSCGIANFQFGGAVVQAPNNFWGTASGPSVDPACGSVSTAPVAPKAFKINAPIIP
jgi:hypothetical protein